MKLIVLTLIAFSVLLFGCLNSPVSNELAVNETITSKSISSEVTNKSEVKSNSSQVVKKSHEATVSFAPGVSWQWQLSGTIDTSYDVNVYDIDLFETPQKVIDELHTKGARVVCYFSTGTFEDFRNDASDFPVEVIGNALDEWPGEKWLDVSHYEKFASVMKKRLDLAKEKKCDAVEPDNVDGYIQDSGFTITASDQLEFNKWLAREAHERNLKVALKNDLDQVDALVSDFDFAVNEQCFEFNECEKLIPFILQNKAVLGVEYNLEKSAFCSQAREMNFSWLKMDLELNGTRDAC